MDRQLVRVRVEAVERDVKDASPEVGFDELRHKLQPPRQSAGRIRHGGLIILGQFVQPLAVGVGVHGGMADEIEQRRAARAIAAARVLPGERRTASSSISFRWRS